MIPLQSTIIHLPFPLLTSPGCCALVVVLQAFGILANLTVLDLPSTSSWSKLLKDYNLLSLLSKVLVPGMAQADLQLEIVLMISTMASDDKCRQQLASSNIISLLYQVTN